MSKNNLQIYLHIIFATKNRNPDIDINLEKALYPFIWNTIQENHCNPLMINGMPDHIHILLKMDSKISSFELMRLIKGKSSRFLNENYAFLDDFEWQRGYGAFSIHSDQVPIVSKYIQNQKKHHGNDATVDDFEL